LFAPSRSASLSGNPFIVNDLFNVRSVLEMDQGSLCSGGNEMKSGIVKRMPLRSLMALLAGTAAMNWCLVANAQLVDRVWTGGASPNGRWSASGNWQGGTVPQGTGNERLIFPGILERNSTNNLSAGLLFDTILIQFGGYEIHGNRVRLKHLIAEYDYGRSVFGPDIQTWSGVLGSLSIELNTQNPVFLDVLGDIILENDLGIHGDGIITMSGAISGTGDIFKDSRGDLIFEGTGANTFAGRTFVDDGWLKLSKAAIFPPAGLISIPGDLYIGDPASVFTATVYVDRDNQIANTALVSIGEGELSLNDHDDAIGYLSVVDSTVTTGTGVLTVNSNISAGGDSTISGRLSLGTASRDFYLGSNVILRIPAAISTGLGGVDVGFRLFSPSGGTLRLSGTNTYPGLTTIQGGTIIAANNAALGSSANGTRLLQNGRLLLLNSDIASESLIMDSDLVTLECGGTSSWGGNITLNGIGLFNAGTGDVFRVTGAISGPGELRKTGGGILRLAGTAANTFDGVAQVNSGTLELQKSAGVTAIPNKLVVGLGGTPDSDVVRLFANHQIADDALVNLSGSGLFDLNGFSEMVRGVTNSGHVALGSGVLTITNESVARVFSGVISGTGQFIKQGAGPFTLAGPNTYVGMTHINGGTLLVNGTLASPLVQVLNGTLGGTGTVQSVTVSSGGTVSPGESPGILNIAGNLTFPNGTFYAELNGPNAGTGYDRLAVSGTVNLGSPVLNLSSGFMAVTSTDFIILSHITTGAINGTFAGLPEGALIGAGGNAFQVTYRGGTGNDMMLTRVAAPASRLIDITRGTNRMTIRGLGLAGAGYAVEATTNLTKPIQWTSIGTNVANTNGIYQFVDTNSPLYTQRFYRGVSQ
jgi:fibronectin-binding autotransporter adhesin